MLLGDSSVGKTCLLVRFKDGAFLGGNFIATVGIDFRVRDAVTQPQRVIHHTHGFCGLSCLPCMYVEWPFIRAQTLSAHVLSVKRLSVPSSVRPPLGWTLKPWLEGALCFSQQPSQRWD